MKFKILFFVFCLTFSTFLSDIARAVNWQRIGKTNSGENAYLDVDNIKDDQLPYSKNSWKVFKIATQQQLNSGIWLWYGIDCQQKIAAGKDYELPNRPPSGWYLIGPIASNSVFKNAMDKVCR